MHNDIFKQVSIKNTATSFLSGLMDNICLGFTNYGYTPMKIGSYLDFAIERAYDFYLDGYCDIGGKCRDVIELHDQNYLCLAQTPEGIIAKYFFSGYISKEQMYVITLEKGELILTNLEIGLYRNKIHRLDKKDLLWD